MMSRLEDIGKPLIIIAMFIPTDSITRRLTPAVQKRTIPALRQPTAWQTGRLRLNHLFHDQL